MPRFVRVALVGFSFACFGLGALVMGIVPWPRSVITARRTVKRWCQRYLAMLRALRLVYVHYPDRPNSLSGDGPFIAIANHPGLLDVVIMFAWLPPTATVVKATHFRSLALGALLRQCEHVTAPRSDSPTDRAATLEQMLVRLRSGSPLLAFPEGTRTGGGDLLPFQRGVFEVARRTGVPIIPVLLEASHRMLDRGQHWYEFANRPLHYRVRVLDPVSAGEESAGAFAQRTRTLYLSELSAAPPG